MEAAFEILAEFAWIPTKYVGDIADINHALERNKFKVMKGLLAYMRGLEDNDICYIMPQILDGLLHAGIKWSELSVIDNSVTKIQQRIEAEELDETDYGDYGDAIAVNNAMNRNRRP